MIASHTSRISAYRSRRRLPPLLVARVPHLQEWHLEPCWQEPKIKTRHRLMSRDRSINTGDPSSLQVSWPVPEAITPKWATNPSAFYSCPCLTPSNFELAVHVIYCRCKSQDRQPVDEDSFPSLHIISASFARNAVGLCASTTGCSTRAFDSFH